MEIYIDNRQDEIEINQDVKEMIKKTIKEVLIFENKTLDCEISVSFVNNDEIQELNKEYRGLDKETDVLSFPMEEEFFIEGAPYLLGDVIISLEKALEQSREYGHSLIREISYLTTHSIFHLLGYDHIDEEEKDVMRSKEKEIMRRLAIFKDCKGE